MGITCINWNIFGFQSSEYREFTVEVRRLDENIEKIYKAKEENEPGKEIIGDYHGTRFIETIAEILE